MSQSVTTDAFQALECGGVIAGVQGALPKNRYSQSEITEMLATFPAFQDYGDIFRKLHSSAKVENRHLVLPIEQYAALTDFGDANRAYIENAVELGSAAILAALDEAGLRPDDVDMIMSTTVTGIAAPSIEARIATRIGLRPDVRRIPMFGLGCVAGAAGVARLNDYLRGAPDGVAVLLSVELCSLTFPAATPSIPGLVGTALFGDGAAAVVAVGAQHALSTQARGPEILDSRSHLYPDSQATMGWEIGSKGFGLVLSADVPAIVEKYLGEDVADFLATYGMKSTDIGTWVSHPGGPKVIESIISTLGLPSDALDLTWRSLNDIGNLSSSSVLHVLRDTLAERPAANTSGMMLAMGPGFCSELVLLRWK